MPRFDLIIPTYNNLGELKACLAALGTQTEKDFHVFVAVDGSTDGTIEFLETAHFGFPMRILFHEGRINRGRPATRNLILPHLASDYLVTLDADMRLQPDALQQHLAVLTRGNTVSVGTAEYLDRNQNVWVRYLETRGKGKFSNGAVIPYNYFVTQNAAMQSADFVKVGGFDAAITGYGGDDIELAYRLQKICSVTFINNLNSAALSHSNKSLETAIEQIQEFGGTSLKYILEKHPTETHLFGIGKLFSSKLTDRIFVALQQPVIESVVRRLVRHLPFRLQKPLISYLVITHVFKGFRS